MIGWVDFLRWVAFCVFAAALPALAQTSGALPAATRIQGQTYWSSTDIARRLGASFTDKSSGQTLRLESAWTKIACAVHSQEASINGVRVFLSDPAAADRGRFFASRRDVEHLFRPVLSPQSAKSPGPVRIIAIDAGHGGHDHGNANAKLKLREKVYTLDVARRLERLLKAAGFKVVMTRTTDQYVSLERRIAIVQRAKADLLVSIHFNGFRDARIEGAETFVMTPRYVYSTPGRERDASMRTSRYPGNAWDHWNAVLGYQVHRELVGTIRAKDRGLKRHRFFVLRMSPCPSVLVEAGFLSNAAEGRKVATAAYRDRIARGIAAGVKAYAKEAGRRPRALAASVDPAG